MITSEGESPVKAKPSPTKFDENINSKYVNIDLKKNNVAKSAFANPYISKTEKSKNKVEYEDEPDML